MRGLLYIFSRCCCSEMWVRRAGESSDPSGPKMTLSGASTPLTPPPTGPPHPVWVSAQPPPPPRGRSSSRPAEGRDRTQAQFLSALLGPGVLTLAPVQIELDDRTKPHSDTFVRLPLGRRAALQKARLVGPLQEAPGAPPPPSERRRVRGSVDGCFSGFH